MIEIKDTESLVLWIINELSRKFPDEAILKGGMVLRLLDCPRHTNGIDYVFAPVESKKLVLSMILQALRGLEGAELSHSINSKCVVVDVRYRGMSARIEASAERECETEALSTRPLAGASGSTGRIIKVMSLRLALSNKLAAWNEREIARDLYDIYFLVRSGVSPDLVSLAKRLDHISYPKGVKGPKVMTMDEFLAKLGKAAAALTAEDLDGLRDILPGDELIGLDIRIRSVVRGLVEKMSATFDRAGEGGGKA